MKAIITIEGKTYDTMPDLIRNDKGWGIVFTLKHNDDSVFDVTTGVVKFFMKNSSTGVLKVNGTCTLTTPATGIVTYTLIAADLDTAAVYLGELQLTLGTAIYSVKLGRFQVLEDLG